jgi:hypothetical protein
MARPARRGYIQDMADRPPKPPAPATKAEREARLAAALRENLRKRKAQARAREEAAKPTEPPAKG